MAKFSTDLIKVDVPNPALVFVEGGTEAIITAIQEKARSVVLDVTTPQGRKDTASLAHQVARSKTFLDEAGKEFVSALKGQVKIVDNERKKVRDTLDALKNEIRKPLTDWEEAKQKIEEEIEYNISNLKSYGIERGGVDGEYTLDHLKSQLKNLLGIEITEESFGDRMEEALNVRNNAVINLRTFIERSEKEEADRLELEKLRKEKEEREEQERIAKAEQERKDREERIAREAAEKAKRKAEEAVAREKERVAKETRDAETIKAKREQDQKHKDDIHKEIATAIAMQTSISNGDIHVLIGVISKDKIPYLKIEY